MIIVAGEAVIDLVEQTAVDGQGVFRWSFGGSPLNVAVGLARLGRRVSYLNAISTDGFGAKLYDHIQSEGVDCRLVTRTGRPSSLAFATVDGTGAADYAFYLEGTADRMLTEVPEKVPDETVCIHFGSLSAALEPAATTIDDFVARAAETRTISFDPNFRPDILSDRAACRDRFDSQLSRCDIVKASADDVRWLYGRASLQDIVRDWSLRGPHLAIVTAGGDGAFAAIEGEVLSVPAVSVDVVDTIGAGDTFQCLILDQLAERGLLAKRQLRTLSLASLRPILATAAAAAALTCSRRGADLPRRHEIESK